MELTQTNVEFVLLFIENLVLIGIVYGRLIKKFTRIETYLSIACDKLDIDTKDHL